MSKIVEINGVSVLELDKDEKEFMRMFIQCINIKDSKYKLWDFEDINLYNEFINTIDSLKKENNNNTKVKIEAINDCDKKKLTEYIERLGIKEEDLLESNSGWVANCCKIIFNDDMTDYELIWSDELNVYTTDQTLFSILQEIEKNTNCTVVGIWIHNWMTDTLDTLYDEEGHFKEDVYNNKFIIKLDNNMYYLISFDDPDDCK